MASGVRRSGEAGSGSEHEQDRRRQKALTYDDVADPVVERTFSIGETAAQLGVHYTKAARIFHEEHPGVLVVSRGPKGRTERRVLEWAIVAYLQALNPEKRVRLFGRRP